MRRHSRPSSAGPLPSGEIGEIGIAGIGVARGYLNRRRADRGQKFIADFLACRTTRRARIYRTGDLGRINADGEIEYLGRIDTAGEDPRLPDRARRDRKGAAGAARDRAGGGRHLRARARRARTRRLLRRVKHGARGAAPAEISRSCARACRAYMVPGLSGAAAVHPDVGQQQGRPRETAEAEVGARFRLSAKLVAPRTDAGAAARARRSPTSWRSTGLHRGRFLQGYRRPFAADGALLRAHPPGPPLLSGRHARHLSPPRSPRSPRALDSAKPSDRDLSPSRAEPLEPSRLFADSARRNSRSISSPAWSAWPPCRRALLGPLRRVDLPGWSSICARGARRVGCVRRPQRLRRSRRNGR